MNITLIGMPGSGKSFVGKKLARLINFDFFDADAEIERKHGMPLQKILEKTGETEFLKIEEETIISKTRGKDKLVISPGGSIVYQSKAMEHLKKISIIIHLKAPLPVIEKRIGNIPRGIVGVKTKTIAALYAQRVPLYEKWAQKTFDADQSADKIVQDIFKTENLF